MKNFNRDITACLLVFSLFSILSAQEETAITVTNSNTALVKEVRTMPFQKGIHTVNLVDIPSAIQASSVLIESRKNVFTVLEQNYEYDLINTGRILEKSIGQNIWIIHPDQGQISGELLSSSSSSLMLLDDEGSLQIIPRSTEQKILLKDYASQKNNFITKPTLVWKVNSPKSGDQPVLLSYLTNGLNWEADYVGRVNEDDTKLTLGCWVTVKNHSGKSYKNARLKLMAGEINIPVQKPRGGRFKSQEMMAASAVRSFEEKSFFEYHLYTLQRTTDLKNNQDKQIQLFPETTSPVKKIYRVDSNRGDDVKVLFNIINSKKNNLGFALPAGQIRLYKSDGDDLEFLGGDNIEHTPKDEKFDITLGTAFDIIAERNVIKSTKPSKRSRTESIEYKIRNHKEEDISVEVIQRISEYQENKLLSKNQELIEQKAGHYKFLVPVKAGGESVLSFEYLTSW